MRWKGRRQSNNIEDHQGGASNSGGSSRGGFGRQGRLGGGLGSGMGRGTRRAGKGGVSGIVVMLVVGVIIYAMGGDLSQVLNGTLGGGGGSTTNYAPQSQPQSQSQTRANDEMTQFMATVLAETEDVWNGVFQAEGGRYQEPKMVLFSGQIQSACGSASSASGPFYCPGDKKVYLDTSFFDQLARQFDAAGDFAQAYVVAHEVGHHVQNLIGVLPKFNKMRRSMSKAQENKMSIRVELQADCFAGIWAHFTDQKGLLERGDIDEALNAANQIGDDTLQRRTQGYVVPESFNHGTSAQRKQWFARGFKSGKLAACDTFNSQI